MPNDNLMHSPHPQPRSPLFGLPNELIELIIIYSAAFSPVSISAIAQTCHAMQLLVYGASDQHLWREIFLTTFDDPRIAERVDWTDPCKPYRSDYDEAQAGERGEALPPEKPFDWCGEFCLRVWALRYFERTTVPPTEEVQRTLLMGERVGTPANNARALQSLTHTISTALPSPPTVVIAFLSNPDNSQPSLRQLPIFPPSPAVCTRSSVVRSSDAQPSGDLSQESRSIAFGYDTAKNIRWLEQAIANGYPPELTLSVSGRDLPGGLQGVWDDEAEAHEMHAFSRLLCCTGFIPIPQPEEEACNRTSSEKSLTEDLTEGDASSSGTGGHNHDDDNEELEMPEDEGPTSTEVVAEPGVIGTTLTYTSATDPRAEAETEAENEDVYELAEPSDDPLPPSKLPMNTLAQKRRARRIARMRVYNMQYLNRERHYGPYLLPSTSKLKDKDRDDLELDFLSPIMELFAEHDAGHPNHHWHDHGDEDGENGEDDDDEVEGWLPMGEGDVNDAHDDDDGDDDDHHHGGVILQFPPEPFPHAPLPPPTELYPDWTYLAAVRIVVEANLREAVRPEALSGLVWLDGLRRGSAPKAVESGLAAEKPCPVKPKDDKGKGKAKETQEVSGWDWAGVEGDWKRCVCWLDYRDLILHNLARQFNDPSLQEAVRIIPMRLRVESYSPCPIPGYDHRPTIHVVGETAGPAGSGTIRKIKGTVGVIADGSIRWHLCSCVEDTGNPEWVTEGVQIGEATSGMGILGMWTGALHERMDPLGPFWAWKVG